MLRDTLRALPTFPAELPVLDPASVPADPQELFLTWLTDAIDSGERQPTAMTVTTVDTDGRPASRTLIVKDVDERGIHFSSSRTSRKAAHLAARPVATLLFFWRPLGRQVEIDGDAIALDEATSQADWRERPSYDGTDNPDWQVWALQPRRLEFLQATHDRRHVRIEYLRERHGWSHRRLMPSEQAR
ncbi:pyridoxine/pyridoxamine 5'-phosphate oxidase [Pseudactinotalea suaedae]|uniref:pyridoxine/pyridoxamine 5'-phosphate oxidase n=1 Tax=Pseudactinotalea suaedae TaxID=1524924 RepID=UPI0012E0F022|nr:pyridoxamine 5'-phosphate oxidase family protein [Pseudactinotalea suaedae]